MRWRGPRMRRRRWRFLGREGGRSWGAHDQDASFTCRNCQRTNQRKKHPPQKKKRERIWLRQNMTSAEKTNWNNLSRYAITQGQAFCVNELNSSCIDILTYLTLCPIPCSSALNYCSLRSSSVQASTPWPALSVSRPCLSLADSATVWLDYVGS